LPPANDTEFNLRSSTWSGTSVFANWFQNKKFSDSNEIQSLKDKIESAINERLLNVPAHKKGVKA
jgi:hypothetical protein